MQKFFIFQKENYLHINILNMKNIIMLATIVIIQENTEFLHIAYVI